MNYHNRFTFEDPEDSYWNEGSSNSSFFDDILAKQESARVALDDLFEAQSAPSSSKLPEPTLPKVVKTSTTSIETTKAAIQRTEKREDSLPPRVQIKHNFPEVGLRKETSAVSIAPSECSLSSLPSEAQQLDLDYNRLRAEHRKLQRQFEIIRAERYRAPDVKETIKRLFLNEPVALDLYKSQHEKMALLDAAIKMIDNNVILAVVLFIRRSVSNSIFREILIQRSEAAEAYLEYLKASLEVDELSTILCALGRTTEAAMIEFGAAMSAKTLTQKVCLLKRCLGSSLLDPNLTTEREQVKRYLDLIERQTQIEATDSQETGKLFVDFPRNASLIGQPACHTLYYSCLYHYDLPSTSSASPQAIKELAHLNDKQMSWASIGALVRQNRWADIERALCPRNLLNSMIRTPSIKGNSIPMTDLMRLLHLDDAQPPKDLLCRLLRTYPDVNQRLRMAEKYMASEVVIECTQQQKDRSRLEAYAKRLLPHSSDHYKVLAALNSTGAKWH